MIHIIVYAFGPALSPPVVIACDTGNERVREEKKKRKIETQGYKELYLEGEREREYEARTVDKERVRENG